MASVTICPEDRDFRRVLLGDASLELEMDLARHMTGCERCAARMHSALSNEQTRKAIQKRGEDRPLWQFYSDASKLTGSAATVRRDDAVEATQHLPKDPSKPPSKEMPLASGGEDMPATMQLAASIYSFLSPPETKDEIGRLGGYCVTKLLGAGGMGMVFQAEDLQLRRKVALKVMRPEVAMITNAHDRFLREARTMASIEHDHVVAVFQVGEERGVPFMAMPFLQGMPLDTVLKKNTSIPLMISLRMGFQIANGLAAAHAQGLIHRDIKPANIWIETQNNNRVKLLDFGLARGNDEEINLTQSGAVLGTPAYMAPEQAAGGAIDARVDIFSLGVVLYELTTGKRPFAGAGTMAILTALAIHNPPPPREVNQNIPENISAFIMRLLEKDPEKRVSSAQEAAKELANLIKAKAAGPKEAPIANDTVGGGNLHLPTIKSVPRHKELSPPSRPALVAAPTTDASGVKRRNLVLAAVGGGVFGLLAITLAVITIFMRTPYGTLEVQIDDPSIEARFKNGSLVLTDDSGKIRYTLRPAAELADKNEKIEAGNYKLRVEGADGLTVETDAFSLKDGKREIVRVILKPNAAASAVETANDKNAKPVSEPFVSIFNGVDLTGWTPMRSPKLNQHEPTTGGWVARDGQLVCDTADSGWLRFDQQQGDFELDLEFQVPKGKNSGILIRHSGLGALYREGGMEIQIEDDPSQTKPNQKIGSIYGAVAAKDNVLRRGEWNRLTILCEGERVAVKLNDVQVVDAKMDEVPALKDLPRKGYIGIYNPNGQGNGAQFQKLRFRKPQSLSDTSKSSAPVKEPIRGATSPALGLEFDGIDDYVETPIRYDGTYPLTIEAFVLPIQIDRNDNDREPTLSLINDIESYRGVGIVLKEQSPKIGAWHLQASTHPQPPMAAAAQPGVTDSRNYGRWTHLAAVVEPGKEMALYVDGKLQAKEKLPTFVPSLLPIFLGVNPGPTPAQHWRHFCGEMAEVRISKSARYQADFSPKDRLESDANTLALYHFEDGSGAILTDASEKSNHGKIIGAKWAKRVDQNALATSSDRQFAEWMIANKFYGNALVGEKKVDFGRGKPLPTEPFFILMLFDDTTAPLPESTLVEGIELFRKLTNLRGGNLPRFQSDRWAQEFSSKTTIEIVNAYTSDISDQGIAEIAKLPALKYLNLDRSSKVTLTGLHALERCTKFETLSLDPASVKEGKFPLVEIQKLQDALPNTKIQLAGQIPIEGLKRVGAKSDSTGATMSEMEVAKWVLATDGDIAVWSNGNFLKPANPQEIPTAAFTFAEVGWKEGKTPPDISSLAKVEEIGHLSICLPSEGEAYLRKAGLQAKIDLLYLSGQQVSAGNTLSDKALAGLKNWQGLKGLSLNKGAFRGSGLASLKEIPSLKKLLIYQCDLNDAGLASLGNNTNLEELSINLCPITDEGLEAVASLANLKILALDSDQVTDQGLAALAKIKNLKSLDIFNNQKITDQALQKLTQALPELKIQRAGKSWMGK